MFMHLLLIATTVASWLSPFVIIRLDPRRFAPWTLITCWLLSMAGVIVALATCTVLQLVPHHLTIDAPTEAAIQHCLGQQDGEAQHTEPPLVEALSGLVGGLLLVGVGTHMVTLAIEAARHRGRTRREYLAVLGLAGRLEPGPPRTLWLAHDRPLAFSLAGRPGTVVVTEGLARQLEPEALAAVLTHERAHLTGRHHLMLAIADVLRTSLRFLPLFRRAPAALRDLIEVAADQAAVRSHGQNAVRAALECVTGGENPVIGLAVNGDAMELRVARLHDTAPPPTRLRQTVSCAAVGLLAVAMPFLLATCFALMISSTVWC